MVAYVGINPAQLSLETLHPRTSGRAVHLVLGSLHLLKVHSYSSVLTDRLIQFPPRIYALTFKNKLLMVYFGSMALTGFIVSVIGFSSRPPEIVTLPWLPTDSASLCTLIAIFKFKLVPLSILTTFGMWLRSFRSLQRIFWVVNQE